MRQTLKRQEFFQIAKLIEKGLEPVPGGMAYRLGVSDTTIADEASKVLKTDIPSEIVARVRKQAIGKVVTDKASVKDKVAQLSLEIAALRKQVIDQGKLIAQLQDRIEPAKSERRPNGAYNGSHP